MTINQVIYNLRVIIKDLRSDDLKFTDRQLEFIVNYIRSKLIKQDIDKGKTISSNIRQDLGIIDLEKIDASESNINSGHKVLRTTRKIPKVIEANFKDLITYVGGIDRLSAFQFSTKAFVDKQMWSKYGPKNRYAYLKDGYIYLANCDLSTRKIAVEGIFENPRDVYNFSKEDGSPCYNPDLDEYPISSYMLQTIYDLIISKEINTFYQLPEDVINDATSEIKK